MRRICALAMGVVSLAAVAVGDTIVLDTGVEIDGVVRKLPDGNVEIDAGGNKLLYRAEEIQSIEENDKTGALDLDEVRREWEARDQELTAKFGLTHKQRQEIDELIFALRVEDDAKRTTIRNRLQAIQQEIDIYPFIEWRISQGLSQNLTPWALEAANHVDPTRARALLDKFLENNFFVTRMMVIELLSRSDDAAVVPRIARGLVDHALAVRTATAAALVRLGAKEATPALIDLLPAPDLRVSNSGKEALTQLWGEDSPGMGGTVDDWRSYWQARKGSVAGKPIETADLVPLISAAHEFRDE